MPSVFKLNARPWIDADGANLQDIINTIKNVLLVHSYSIDGHEQRDQNERAPMVTVSRDGPYIITGGINLILDDTNDTQFGDGGSKEHYTLCRCGASKNKPFCDGMHKLVDFHDEKS